MSGDHSNRHGTIRGSLQQLESRLHALDGKGYGQYRSIEGSWEANGFVVELLKAQTDPFAPASRVEVRVPARTADFPEHLWANRVRARGLADFVLRALGKRLRNTELNIDVGGQEVLDRSAVRVHDGDLTLRMGLNLPGPRRRIDGKGARKALCEQLPDAVNAAARHAALDAEALEEFVYSVEDTDALRRALPSLGLVGFVADCAMLARRSGTDDRPLADGIPFHSPESLRVSVDLPNRGRVSGMGVGEGITLIAGGGFHGKSTLLRALEHGVYDHIPGDGRELVVSRDSAVKVRAEDGRSVQRVDVSSFVGRLPNGADTSDFSTTNASGSTSQAATTVEALEAGADVLLIDEDTAATNMMIRDARMQALVAKDNEPLTPFIDLARPLYSQHGVSTVLAMGGSGDYLDIADRVIMMAAYEAYDVTAEAFRLRSDEPERRTETDRFPRIRQRVCRPDALGKDSKGKRRIKQRGTDTLVLGGDDIDLRAVEQIVDTSQVMGIGLALSYGVEKGLLDGKRSIAEFLDLLERDLDESGADALQRGFLGDFAVPRRYEVAAALARLRSLRISATRDGES
ncbi:ABC-ATPase domain-containing protein [Haloechinothrix sp. YIM 98757]|uniref:ABC-ATPase domain-containing protein n=1 Tax=Haloechinothrix aidingensis TaxID=2752311 RepID=A0A838A7W0_9PSEU|nr:ABC-ATPase domain-containing protein [Haloechinothrix aidingensis]MBA0124481.1 ABC-ATPase domain-containing protein [Haloechinothrix aidingensis]